MPPAPSGTLSCDPSAAALPCPPSVLLPSWGRIAGRANRCVRIVDGGTLRHRQCKCFLALHAFGFPLPMIAIVVDASGRSCCLPRVPEADERAPAVSRSYRRDRYRCAAHRNLHDLPPGEARNCQWEPSRSRAGGDRLSQTVIFIA